MLRVGERLPLTVRTTLLALQALPPGSLGREPPARVASWIGTNPCRVRDQSRRRGWAVATSRLWDAAPRCGTGPRSSSSRERFGRTTNETAPPGEQSACQSSGSVRGEESRTACYAAKVRPASLARSGQAGPCAPTVSSAGASSAWSATDGWHPSAAWRARYEPKESRLSKVPDEPSASAHPWSPSARSCARACVGPPLQGVRRTSPGHRSLSPGSPGR